MAVLHEQPVAPEQLLSDDALAEEAPSETAAFEQRLAADPDDHEARFELAKAFAGAGRLQDAADHLLTIIARDRAWNEEAARSTRTLPSSLVK